jgi:hypothetical protein
MPGLCGEASQTSDAYPVGDRGEADEERKEAESWRRDAALNENRNWSSCRILIAIGIDFRPASTVRVAVRVDRRCLLAVNESGDESGSR